MSSQSPLPPHPDREDREGLEALFEALLEGVRRREGGRLPDLRGWLELAEAWRIAHALRCCRGNRSAAARTLGVGRRTLYSKMEKLGITPHFQPWREQGRSQKFQKGEPAQGRPWAGSRLDR